ncbi:hypothetical protein SLINC_8317 [Streptomyces lincolnensis]|uniref:Uncharacterized protein n=1 Tax=Streptomyces lincolnensis TaxID=1915 RepID=A0A1B1MPL3_STRLN|nr:acyl carrier protein [Streptomyces lincolnensis]ANS70541.1 hypothetical protein SLINC_8317 [Streptomyces lincolnensis]
MRTAIPESVRTELLDCIQVNLAVPADRWHGPRTHLALGAALRFRPRARPDELPSVEPLPGEQIEDACARLGLVVTRTADDLAGPDIAALADNGSVYAVGDAYDMPWLPYAGKQHMLHSFLVERGDREAVVTDAYRNETRWGTAVPGQFRTRWEELPAVRYARVIRPAADGPSALGPTLELGDPTTYLAAFEHCPDQHRAVEQLTVETWLLTRSRRLHAAFRAQREQTEDNSRVREHLRRWDDLAAHAFISLRRLRRGPVDLHGLLARLADALAADQDVFRLTPSAVAHP